MSFFYSVGNGTRLDFKTVLDDCSAPETGHTMYDYRCAAGQHVTGSLVPQTAGRDHPPISSNNVPIDISISPKPHSLIILRSYNGCAVIISSMRENSVF